MFESNLENINKQLSENQYPVDAEYMAREVLTNLEETGVLELDGMYKFLNVISNMEYIFDKAAGEVEQVENIISTQFDVVGYEISYDNIFEQLAADLNHVLDQLSFVAISAHSLEEDGEIEDANKFMDELALLAHAFAAIVSHFLYNHRDELDDSLREQVETKVNTWSERTEELLAFMG